MKSNILLAILLLLAGILNSFGQGTAFTSNDANGILKKQAVSGSSGRNALPDVKNATTQANLYGLVAYYPFNGNANDESGNGNNGTVEGATLTTDRFGINGNAYGFDGANDFITIADNPDLFSDEMTISWWYKLSETPGSAAVVIGWVDGGHRYQQFFSGGELDYFNGYNVGAAGLYFNPIIGLNDLNVWKNVVVTYKKLSATTSATSVYVDGELKQNDTHSLAMDYAPGINFLIGKNHNGNYFKGAFDDLRIFNRVLGNSEIALLYNDSTTYFPSDNKLVAYFPFNGNANDESGNENNPTYIGSGVTLSSDRFGNPDQAYYFDGNADSYIRIPADNFPTTDRTISFWFNADQLDNHPTPLSYGGETCNNSLLMIINKGGYPNAYTVLSHCGSNFITAPYSEAPVNKWYYLTMTISGATQKIFINGKLLQSENSFTNATLVAGKSAILGALLFTDGYTVYVDPSAGNFQGKLDDFRFYTKAMTDLEVLNLYNTEAEGLVAYYPFSGNANDASDNHNDGVVNNAALTTDRYGIADKAYAFNGTDSYIEGMDSGKNLPVGNSSRSFAAWIKDNVYQYYGSNIFHYGTAEVAPTNFHFLITDVLGLGNGYGYGVTYGKTNLIDSTWHLVCGTYDSTNQTVKLYLDGKPDNAQALSTAPNTKLATKWRMGLFMVGGTPLNGKLDEIRVFKTVLTDQQIKDMYVNETTASALLQPLNQSNNASLSPVLQWSSTFPDATFRFQVSDDSLFTTTLLDQLTQNQETTVPDGLLSEGINYYWRVRTTLNGETGPWSEVWKFITLNTGLNPQLRAGNLFAISPNPAGASVKITFTVSGQNAGKTPVNIELLNSMGGASQRLIDGKLAPGPHSITVSTENLKPGIYYCRIKTATQTEVRKLVIAR